MMNSQFLHQQASFQSVFRVWQEMHPETLQQLLLNGGLGTLERNNTVRLEDAWFVWSATTWAEGCDADISWDFASPQEFDGTLLQYEPVLRERNFRAVVGHIPDCPRCQHMLALVSDGKAGASRRVCANMNKFKVMPELKVAIHTGCASHADSNNLYCEPCDAWPKWH